MGLKRDEVLRLSAGLDSTVRKVRLDKFRELAWLYASLPLSWVPQWKMGLAALLAELNDASLRVN